ncbi:EscU/YscU/HrcU family type III secretion system export apparatus switch protein [Halarcobacter bivalviorum]|uniref:FlhB C-terminus-related protein n=1 Tax=Halarcobacter bivalviorum TaxID=663364 RepID=A0AAX2ABC2_9BACT|nr:EscU/YscU/HrcU family type III secretion system export apparatus switch protein [Halarcobacter bivalviorum]AXH12488.1 FlhB C-terminus-related protein [Halarcobacter bivalviorum]RXK07936.1 type III secretion system protein [Halarcobacter bivalviorum]RXK10588.1 type III secretion system protein [Halarcobacter bivalviorum]
MQEREIKKAVALDYEMEIDNAPKIVAKGKGEIANNIIKIAQDNDIPIKKDEDLVELLSAIDIDKEIPPSMYKAVSEIFAFIYDLTTLERKKREQEKVNDTI